MVYDSTQDDNLFIENYHLYAADCFANLVQCNWILYQNIGIVAFQVNNCFFADGHLARLRLLEW